MKVILADYSGFCFGVENAINTTLKEIDNKDENKVVSSLGPLIHNDQVVKELKDKGVNVINNIDDAIEGSIIIRSHGVPKNIYEKAKNNKLEIIDATCPFVRRIQNIVKSHEERGYNIVIIGNPSHPEVIGINGWCNNKAIIIEDEEDIKKIPKTDKLCVVVQTTMSLAHYEKISNKLDSLANEVVKFNTICSATKERQSSAKNLAEKVDVMIVIGGFHSSNTQKLVEICKSVKPNATFHIETLKDLPLNELSKYKTVGITAGASTPQWIIDEIMEKLKSI
ncbi:MAG: 4-hydroxy-3-methylbut-2-enyl diphosphate reductase [Clostridiales bacterium]|nr:4-hydroxy-3-methylbut-2-enyl diphosphate reductase [Clostridiales bacterium]